MREQVGFRKDPVPAPPKERVAKIEKQADPAVAPKRGPAVGDVLKKAIRKATTRKTGNERAVDPAVRRGKPRNGHDEPPKRVN